MCARRTPLPSEYSKQDDQVIIYHIIYTERSSSDYIGIIDEVEKNLTVGGIFNDVRYLQDIWKWSRMEAS